MRFARVITLALVLSLGGCRSAPLPPPPPVSYEPVGELGGTWSGRWGETPLTLVITEETEGAPYSGLYFGPWLVAGSRYPGIGGILTFASAGSPATVRFDGWIYSSRPFTVFVRAEALDGPLQMRLNGGGAGRLIGEGQSMFRWGPQGPIELTRQ